MVTISVVMPVYNAARFLPQAVESILNQSFTDFELVAIDDGSTDHSYEILAEYQQHDPRIKIHRQPQNKGLVEALNTGCQFATGEYIARMDADDVSLPHRFEKQLAFMRNNPEVGVLGAWVDYVDEHGLYPGRVWHPPVSPWVIKWRLLFGPPLAHPTWIFRRKLGESLGFYRPLKVEDYDFLVRASRLTQIANVPEVLLHYRFWSQSKSTVNAKTEAPTTASIMITQMNELMNGELSVGDGVRLYYLISGRLVDCSLQQVMEYANLIAEMYQVFRKKHPLTTLDQREIAIDAGVKLLTFSALIARRSPINALAVARKSLAISPRAPMGFVRKVIKNLREKRASV